MDNSEELKVWRWLDRYVDVRVQYCGPDQRAHIWIKCKSLISAHIAELTKDETVEVVLRRGAWDGICTLLGDEIEGHIHCGRFQDAEVLRNYRDKIRAQLEAKSP